MGSWEGHFLLHLVKVIATPATRLLRLPFLYPSRFFLFLAIFLAEREAAISHE